MSKKQIKLKVLHTEPSKWEDNVFSVNLEDGSPTGFYIIKSEKGFYSFADFDVSDETFGEFSTEEAAMNAIYDHMREDIMTIVSLVNDLSLDKPIIIKVK